MSSTEKIGARIVQGVVVSTAMEKTAVILISRKVKNKLGKYVKKSSKAHIHDQENICKLGDEVLAQETRPLSKTKTWKLLKILSKTEKA